MEQDGREMRGGHRRQAVLWGALLVLLTIAAYLPALRAGFVWDDDMHVTGNATLRTLDGLRRIWLEPRALPQYYPLVHTTFWLEYRLFGLAPFGYHLANVLLHAGNALLVWTVLRRLAVPGAWLAGAVFALHPVHVESVAWVTERKNVLSTAFYLGSALCLLRFFAVDARDDNARADDAAERPLSWAWYFGGFALFLGALLSKTVTASLPAAVLLVLYWKKGRIAARDVVVSLPLFAVGATFGLATAWLERHHVGAQGEAWDLSIVERCLIAGRAVWFYAGKLVWPHPLAFIYSRFEIDARAWGSYLFPLAALAAAAALWLLRGRIGRAPLVAVLCFGGTLFPALGFFNVFPMRYSFVADHFQYLASIGLIALGCAAVVRAARRYGVGRAATTAAAGLALGSLAAATFVQTFAYCDAETLWRDTLAKNPGAWMAHTNLGLLLVGKGEVEEGMAHYRESIRLEPTLVEPRLNLGEQLIRQERFAEAIAVIEEAVRVRPGHAMARYNLGTALARSGRYAEAIVQLTEAVRLLPDFAEAEYNLATAHLKLDRLPDAEEHYRRTLRVRPDHANAHANLAAVLERTGRSAEAASHRGEAQRLKAGR